MKNSLTFPNVIGILLEHKKKTYPQYQLVTDLFSLCIKNERDPKDADLIANDNITYSRWCSGARPIPMDIVKEYETDNGWQCMEDDFRERIIPNLINENQARQKMAELLENNVSIIGGDKLNEICSNKDNAAFFMEMVRYAILNNHGQNELVSQDMSEIILENRIPSCTDYFVGRKEEMKEIERLLKEHSLIFISGVAGIGKSEFAKMYALKNSKKYTNIIYMHYQGNLKKSIAGLSFSEDSASLSKEELFDSHYGYIKKLHRDSLLLIDNFNVLPKDDEFFHTLKKCDLTIIITTRCKITSFPVIKLSNLDNRTELPELFCHHCPSAKAYMNGENADMEPADSNSNVISDIIHAVHCHTLTVCLAALTLAASGMEPEELLEELKKNGVSVRQTEEVELYKDEELLEATMAEHLKTLLRLNYLDEMQLDLMRNLSLLPASGIPKVYFKKWLALDDLNGTNHLIRYGLVAEDTYNRKISLHPMIADVALDETKPCISTCRTLIDSLHVICLVHGMELMHPIYALNTIKSINAKAVIDQPEYCLRFLQDTFPFYEKYGDTEYMQELVERIEYIMQTYDLNSACDKALILDYKAAMFSSRKQYSNAIKKRNKALSVLEPFHTPDADLRTAQLLSNLHANLSSSYLLNKDVAAGERELKTAIAIRKEYCHLEGIENHDVIQQMLQLISLFINSRKFDEAKALFTQYENLVSATGSTDCLDYAHCVMLKGQISMIEGNAIDAEKHLLYAESLFARLLGTESEDVLLARKNLIYLYSHWNGHEELAKEYKNKLLN